MDWRGGGGWHPWGLGDTSVWGWHPWGLGDTSVGKVTSQRWGGDTSVGGEVSEGGGWHPIHGSLVTHQYGGHVSEGGNIHPHQWERWQVRGEGWHQLGVKFQRGVVTSMGAEWRISGRGDKSEGRGWHISGVKCQWGVTSMGARWHNQRGGWEVRGLTFGGGFLARDLTGDMRWQAVGAVWATKGLVTREIRSAPHDLAPFSKAANESEILSFLLRRASILVCDLHLTSRFDFEKLVRMSVPHTNHGPRTETQSDRQIVPLASWPIDFLWGGGGVLWRGEGSFLLLNQ